MIYAHVHLGLEGITEVDTDQKWRFVSLKVTPSNDRVLCLYPFREQQQRTAGQAAGGGDFFEGLESYMQNKNEGNENKIIHGDVNCTMDKIDRDDEN